jgi:hypothetical protein
MFDSSSGGSSPSLEPSAVSRWEIARRPERRPRRVAQGHAGEVDDDRAHHETDAGGGAQRHKFPATDHAPNMTGLGGLR